EERNSFEDLFTLMEHGHRIQGGHGSGLIHYLVGTAAKGMAVYQLTNLVEKTTLPPQELLTFVSRFDAHRANPGFISNVVKLEHRLNVQILTEMSGGQFVGTTNSAPVRTITKVGMQPFFSHAKSKETFARLSRLALASSDQVYADMPIIPELQKLTASTNRETTKLLLSGNAIGQIFTSMIFPAYDSFFVRKCNEDSLLSAAQTMFALRTFKDQHGRLPEKLEELVPHYLPALPRDGFDGKPLKYSAEKRILYSVGKDLVDSGGVEKTEQSRKGERLDILFPIPF
ncbi:MAG: hypothetical protein ACK4UN_19635, partial [Limisphaerales bacterium]